MNGRQFFLQLLIISAVTALLIFLGNQWPLIAPYSDLAWMSLALFIGISLLMYYTARRAALSDNKYSFNNSIIGFTMGKMALSVILILVYNKMYTPESKWFIFPFFMIYLIYTIFETYFLTKLGKLKKQEVTAEEP